MNFFANLSITKIKALVINLKQVEAIKKKITPSLQG